jgi:hypothetical protein
MTYQYYDRELNVSGSAEDFKREARYLNNASDLPRLEKMIEFMEQDLKMDTPSITKNDLMSVIYRKEMLIEERDYPNSPFNIGQMKKDLTEGYYNFEDFKDGEIEVSMLYEKNDYNGKEIDFDNDKILVSVYKYDAEANEEVRGTNAFTPKEFFEMSHKDFDVAIGETYFYAERTPLEEEYDI